VLDMAGVDGRKPWEDFASLRNELELYQPGLSERNSVIVANKADLEKRFSGNLVKFATLYPQMSVFPVCAKKREGLEPVMDALQKLSGN